MVTTFEWGILGVAVIGFALPAWLLALSVRRASQRQFPQDINKRYFAYAELLKSLHAQMDLQTKTVRNGPLFAATVRELENYPEYRHISVLFLEEITITGSKKFDQVVRAELKAVEAKLLEPEQV